MKTTEEKKNVIIKSKKCYWNGKEYTETLTSGDVEDMKRQADIFKLNGWSEEVYLEEQKYHVRKHWRNEAVDAFRSANPVLAVGMGATMNLYSDRRAMTIVEIVSPKKIVVAHNETKCIDYYAGDYKVLDTIADYMGKSTFTLRKNGTWVEQGQPKKYGSVTLTVGFRRHYIDPSF